MCKKAIRGSSTVEFAVLAPVIMLLFVGGADFARVFYHAIVMSGAAASGSYFGAQNVFESGNLAGIQALASNDAGDLITSVTATASRQCECPPAGGGGATVVDCITGVCTGYGIPRTYVRTNVQQGFDLMIPWPGVPDSLNIGRNVWLRVQ